ncbi:hypothetical protein IV203_025572 [Nitzschia inconspicua]|uniref:Uncharacterized protein n=1 Tax=Nitzschia inconspicua TaxID=303405 RepID=A0A9K3LJ38_9STRA|nr:hypothetical protein IV203_017640 [Nitzschia inconspicua]KAG7361906.1 hypothetical protein IV203_025572 [Nitzschia inconspicua]
MPDWSMAGNDLTPLSTARFCRKQTGPKSHLLWRKRKPLPWEQQSFPTTRIRAATVQRHSKKQYTMMCLIYRQALQLGRMLVRAATRITEAVSDPLHAAMSDDNLLSLCGMVQQHVIGDIFVPFQSTQIWEYPTGEITPKGPTPSRKGTIPTGS